MHEGDPAMKDRLQRNLSLILAAGAAVIIPGATLTASDTGGTHWYDQYKTRASVSVTGTLRDFYKKNKREADPSFDKWVPKLGKGHYMSMIGDNLDADGKPAMNTMGFVFYNFEWADSLSRNILWPQPYIDTLAGDHALFAAGKSPKFDPKNLGDALFAEE